MNLLPHVCELSIVDKNGKRRRLGDVINWPQQLLVETVSRNLAEGRQTRIIILKARQLGFSTISEALQFTLAMLVDYFSGLVITHNTKSNKWLLQMAQRYYDSYPYREFYDQTGRAQNYLKWEPTNSGIQVATAKTLDDGRGLTYHYVHASEAAKYPDAGGLMASLGPAIPKSPFSFIIIESTAVGIGNWFEQTWQDSVTGQNDYVPIFIPWQVHSEYTADHLGINPIADDAVLDEEEERLYRQFRQARLDEECRLILSRTMDDDTVAELSQPIGDDEIRSRLAWRRWIIRNELAKTKDGHNPFDLFRQEYPDCPRVAFLSTGQNVFPLPFLETIYQSHRGSTGDIVADPHHRFQESPTGPLTVWKLPSDGEQYIVAGDPTFTVSGDYGCIQVLNRRTWEQVARYRAKVDPAALGKKMCELGWFYNTALLAPETNKDGSTTIGRIMGLDYPRVWQRQNADQQPNYSANRFGWHTNTRTKVEAIGTLKALVVDGSVTIHDPHTFSEMKNYVDLGLGQYGNANGEPNDDTVMSLAIAATVNAYESDEMLAYDAQLQSHLGTVERQLNDMTLALSGGGEPTPYDGGDTNDW